MQVQLTTNKHTLSFNVTLYHFDIHHTKSSTLKTQKYFPMYNSQVKPLKLTKAMLGGGLNNTFLGKLV